MTQGQLGVLSDFRLQEIVHLRTRKVLVSMTYIQPPRKPKKLHSSDLSINTHTHSKLRNLFYLIAWSTSLNHHNHSHANIRVWFYISNQTRTAQTVPENLTADIGSKTNILSPVYFHNQTTRFRNTITMIAIITIC